MCVALPLCVMLLSDIFIIYLAAAAPFGVSRFLSEHAGGAGTLPALLSGAGAALAWPFTSLARLLGRDGETKNTEGRDLVEQRVEHAKRAAVNALRAFEDSLEEARAIRDEAGRHTLYLARECVERYAGLALAAAHASPQARPSAREMELCRIAGRGGDDLLTAGRCVHRRNVTRLIAHRERASAELVQSLAAVCALARDPRETPRALNSEEQLRADEPGQISEALPRALSRVVELLSLLDDRATADGVARLLDAVRELRGRAESPRAADDEGEEPCTTQAVPTAFASSTFRITTSHGD
ncbi:MAG TPA: hypothetical protein VF611_00605 [Pyrinomonadaceae bacterium]|jgi:hypothetical protein